MKNAINLIDDILKNMEYVRMLFKRDKDITPLHTFDLVVKQLNKLRVMVDVENPIESGDPLDSITVGDDLTMPLSGSPFYRDSVGTEELYGKISEN